MTGHDRALAHSLDDVHPGGIQSVQVLMDILGVAITCVTCNFVLEQLAQSLT